MTSRFDRAPGLPPDDGGPSEEPSRLASPGLAADREAAAAAADGTLLKLALERGFDRAASLVYFPADEARAGVPAVSLPPMALASARHQPGLSQAQLEFVAPSGRFSAIRLRR